MSKQANHIAIMCDTRPLELFIKLFKAVLQIRQRSFNFRKPRFKLARIESDYSSTNTGELTVRFYPSNAFLRFAATLLAREFDLGTIQKTGHNSPLSRNNINPLNKEMTNA